MPPQNRRRRTPKMTSRSRGIRHSQLARFMRRSGKGPKPLAYLTRLLPAGSLSLYAPQRTGASWGIPIVCPFCLAKPPHDLSGYQRHRWMSLHKDEHARGKGQQVTFDDAKGKGQTGVTRMVPLRQESVSARVM